MTYENAPLSRRAEVELLLCCARTHVDPEGAERISHLLGRELDWNYLIGKASWHGLLPLLYWNIRGINPQAVPTTIWSRLEAHFHWNTKRCLFLTGELFKILDLFSTQGIKACPFKGPLLSVAFYGNIGLRSFGDLDILVPREDIHKAVDLLTSLGYGDDTAKEQLDTDAGDVDPERIGYLQPHHYTMTRDVTSLGLGSSRVDLQWRISETHFAFSLDSEKRWAQLTDISILNRKVPSFPLDDLFLILSVHGCKHYWYRMKWICDIAEILRTNEAQNWNACMETAKTLGVERMIKLSFFLARNLLDAPVPSALWQEIAKDSGIISTARWISQRLFVESEGRISNKRLFFFYLGMKDNWLDRVRHSLNYVWQFLCAIITPTRKEQAIIRLPSLLFFLYYFIRPLRLSAKYSRRTMRRTRN